MKFPRLVFISPGSVKCNGGTYDAELVKDQEDHDAAIKAGFFSTLPEALKALEEPDKPNTNVVDDPQVDKAQVQKRTRKPRAAKAG